MKIDDDAKYSNRINFASDAEAWFWVLRYIRENNYKFSAKKPLAKEFYNQVRNIISPKKVSSRDLYRAIGFHVNSINYLKCMKPNAKRFNLWGRISGVVSVKEAEFAREKMASLHSEYLKSVRKSRKAGANIVYNNKNTGGKSTSVKGKIKMLNFKQQLGIDDDPTKKSGKVG